MPTENDVRDAMRDLARDVSSPDEFAARLARRSPRRPSAPLAVAAAVVVVLIAVITSIAVGRQQHDSLSSQPLHTPPPTDTARTTGPPVPTGTAVPTSVALRDVPAGWRTEREGIVVHYPSVWRPTKFTGAPATVAAPLFYLSARLLGGPCPPDGGGPSDRAGGTTCFNGSWRVPSDAVIISWRESELPNNTWYRIAPGATTTIDGHIAKVYSGIPVDDDCGPATATEISAVITMTTHDYAVRHDSDDYIMRACLGPHVPTSERGAVYTMLASVRIGR